MTTAPFVLLLAVLAWGVVSHFRSESQQKRDNQRRADAQETQVQQSIMQLANANSAVTDWKRQVGKQKLFSAELATAFIRRDGRPLLFIVSLRDVNTSIAGYEIEFDAYANLQSKVRLVLRCSSEQADQVMHSPRNSGGRYVVVARIDSVQSGDAVSYEDTDGEKEKERVTVARGTCIQLRYIGLYFTDLFQDMMEGLSDSKREKEVRQ